MEILCLSVRVTLAAYFHNHPKKTLNQPSMPGAIARAWRAIEQFPGKHQFALRPCF